MKLVALVAVLCAGCPSTQSPSESPRVVKRYKQEMDSAKKDVEAAQKREEQRDDKLIEQAK